MDEKYLRMLCEEPNLFKNLEGGIDIITDPKLINQIEKEHNTSIGVIYEDDYIILLKDAVRFADLKTGPYIRVYYKSHGGASIFVTYDDKILLIKHFRHSLRRWIWETPRGFTDAGESSAETAVREMSEELGVTVSTIEYLGDIFPDAGIIGEHVSLYCAKLNSCDKIRTEEHEGIKEIGLFSKEEFIAAIKSGEIADGITIASFTLATLKGVI